MIEDMGKTGLRDTNTRVGNREGKPYLPGSAFLDCHVYPDMSVFGEFKRVADEIDQHLVQPVWVATEHFRDSRVHLYQPGEVFFLYPVGEHGCNVVQDVFRPEFYLLDGQLTGFYL